MTTTHRVSGQHPEHLLGPDGDASVAVSLDVVVGALFDLADFFVVVFQIENLVPHGRQRRLHVLHANGRPAFGGVGGHGLLHDGAALGEQGLFGGRELNVLKGTGADMV